MLETMVQVLHEGFLALWVEGKRQGLFERNLLPFPAEERVVTEVHPVGWHLVWYSGRSVTRSIGEFSEVAA